MIKVAIYEDNSSLREVLATIIRESTELELAGEFGHCLDIVKNTEAYLPQVIIMDFDMPGMTGIEGVIEVKKYFPEVEIIMNTGFEEDEQIFNAIKAGATGYLLKRNSLSTMIQSIKEVVAGGAPINSAIARRLLLYSNFPTTKKSTLPILTDREKEILELMAKGMSYKMVAEQIHLSVDTIRSHVKKLYQKLQVHSITEAVNKVYFS